MGLRKLKGLNIVRRHRQNKFNARRDRRNGYGFDSQAEARYYDQLELRRRAGDVLFYARQVPIDLGGGVTYRVDFLVVTASGDVELIDVKGRKTKEFITKKKLVEAEWPVEIHVVKAKEV